MIMPERFNSISQPSKIPLVQKELTSITSWVLTQKSGSLETGEVE